MSISLNTMDSEGLKTKTDILNAINALYDEKTRESALAILSEQKCDTTLRSTCLFNSFGIVTILQQEILGAYKNINNEKLTEQAEKRLCNTLTIVRSLVTNPDIAYHFLNSYILYYIGPLIEASNPRFVNIRKVSLAVLLEVSMHNDRNGELKVMFINQNLISVCLNVFKLIILMILYNILYNIHALNLIMNTPRYSKMIFEVMVICGVDQVKQKEDGKAIQTCWEKIINLLYDNNHRSLVTAIRQKIREIVVDH
ncbi:cell differentiation protein RCD1 [Blastocystis sp. subtype 4]|uniref:cell differentiation protein RCD1 n=1 Tax=Blastocystis sp. subtype 4 TaxID=944170 RepID=UPI000711FF06|nr:cell differentiation protein RCD1 [Blastocystis sp. subtype 4]KNB46848.1 cell differentiation protein RCD1 [Blastocystis sp. subtype 4]|eukprot:XP_014530291.1 cell differentiation protein RCD1 [Blastocystis sp. subtype 4]